MGAQSFGVKSFEVVGTGNTSVIGGSADLKLSATGQVAITTNTSVTGVITATSFVGDGSGLTGIAAVDSSWVPINLPGDGLGTYGQPLGIHTTKHVGIGRTADSATVLYIESATVGSAGTPFGLRVDGFADINNVKFDYTNNGYTRFLFPGFLNTVGGAGNGYGSALQYDLLNSVPFHVRLHSKFTKTVQIGTSFYDLGDGPILYPNIFMDGGSATIAVGLGITINGCTGIITATGFSGGAAGVSVSGVITATSFSGDGSGLTGLTGASANTYGNGTAVPQITVDSNGRITGISNVLISGGGGGGSSIIIKDDNSLVGTAGTINFGTGLTVSSVVDGAVTITGITTADIRTNTLSVSGLSTFSNNVNITGTNQLVFGDSTNTILYNDGTDTRLTSAGALLLRGGFQVNNTVRIEDGSSNVLADFNSQGSVDLYYNNSKKFETTNGGAVVTGILTATSFVGDGSNVTGISTLNIVNYGVGLGGGGVVGSAGTWAVNAAGIHTTKNVGIGTALSSSALTVEGDGRFSGVVTATRFESTSAGTPTIDSPNNLNINAVTVAISTDLTVGDTLTVGGVVTINSTGLSGSGIHTATSFRTNSTVGDGSDVGFAIKYYVTANGTSAYRFAGPGLVNTTDNPTFYLQRGFTYIFENSTGGSHPFRIQFTGTTTGVGTYVSGSQTGTQVFTVPFDAPSSYQYQCTIHGGMLGTFNVA